MESHKIRSMSSLAVSPILTYGISSRSIEAYLSTRDVWGRKVPAFAAPTPPSPEFSMLKDLTSAQLESFFALVPDMMCIVSLDGYFKKLNSAWETVLGHPIDELLSQPFSHFIHPDDVEPTMAEVERRIGGHSTIDLINRYRCKDGSYKWLEWKSIPAEGKTLLYAVARDITERKQAEAALLDAEDRLTADISERACELKHPASVLREEIAERKRAEKVVARLNQDLQRRVDELQAILDTTPIGLAIADGPSAATIRGNRSLEKMLGIQPNGEFSKSGNPSPPYRVLREGCELATADLPMQRAVLGEIVAGEVVDVIRGDGTSVTVCSSAAPLIDSEGRIRGAVGAFVEITQLRQAEEELRRHRDHLDALVRERTAELAGRNAELLVQIDERSRAEALLLQSQQRYRAIIETQTEYVDRYLPGGILTYVNDALANLFGLPSEELLGTSFYHYFHEDDRKTVVQVIEALTSGNPVAVTEHRYVLPHGVYWHQWTHRALFDADGTITEYQSVGRDITRIKQAEETQKLTIELLHLCNKAETTLELMRSLTFFFQQLTGCEAVGVRLQDGDGYPYYATLGFPDHFVLAENDLCTRDQAGELLRDSMGHPVLKGMCGTILCGRWDASESFFSVHGSFWSNCTTELLASTTEADRQTRIRDCCNGEGYESVALLPIRSHGKIVGLFQFNDTRRGCFTVEKISQLENLVDYVAIALAKLTADEALQKSEQSLRESEERYRLLFEQSLDGILLTRPDGTIMQANPAACSMFGKTEQELIAGGSAGIVDATDPRVAVALEERARTGKVKAEVTFLRQDSSAFPGEVTSAQFRSSCGEEASSMIIRDNTERRETEKSLREYARRLVELEEEMRKKLAAELHDEIGRDLTALNINFAMINNGLSYELREMLGDRIEDSTRLIEDMSRTVRGLMAMLRPPLLDDFGLSAALRWFTDAFSKRTGMSVSVEVEAAFPRLRPAVEAALFRIVQEALMNAAKHADTRSAAVTLVRDEEAVRLAVIDHGKGFDWRVRNGFGWGLTIMRERAAQVGGIFTVESIPGRETIVSVEIQTEGL